MQADAGVTGEFDSGFPESGLGAEFGTQVGLVELVWVKPGAAQYFVGINAEIDQALIGQVALKCRSLLVLSY